MIRKLIPLAVVLVLAAFVGTSSAVTPQQTIKQLRSQLAAAKKANGRLTNQNDKVASEYLTAKANLATETATVSALQATIAAQATGGVQAAIAGGPDAMWAAMVALWTAFPLSPPAGEICGYKKSDDLEGGTGLSFNTFEFELVANCS